MGSFVGKVTDAIGLTDIGGTQDRANQAAAATAEAARRGAAAAAFRPVGITSRFGTSDFDITKVGGIPRVTGASYEVAPELVSIQDRLMALTGGVLTDAEAARGMAQPLTEGATGLFDLAKGYLAQTPEQAREQYMREQYALLDPVRQREEQRLGAGVFGRGRAGLNIGDIGQPELFALSSARRQQDLELAARADRAAMERASYGAGLFGTGADLLGAAYGLPTTALGPLSSYLGTVGTIEEMGQQPFNLGLAVGGAAQPGASAAANLLTQGLTSAANTRRAGGDAASSQLTGFMNQMLNAAIGGFGSGGQAPAPIYDRNIYR
jgi:hypothetical protein